MKRTFTFLIAALMLLTMMATTGKMWGQSYTVATSISVGDVVLLVRSDVSAELNGFTTSGTLYGISANVANSTPAGLCPLTVVAGSQDGKFAFKTSDNKYLSWSSGNTLTTSNSIDDNSSWTVSISPYGTHIATVSNVNTSGRQIKYNSSSPRFACYTSGQQTVAFFKQSGPTQLSTPTNFAATPGNTQATFTWTAVEHASSYTISYTPNGGAEQTVASITDTSKTIEGLTNGTEYTCKIKAVGDGENYSDSDYSSTITVTPTAATFHNINITSPLTGGSVEASVATATATTTITLTATPSAGYTFSNIVSNWSVVDGSSNTVTVTPGEGNTATFEMPESDVTVSATFTAMPVYTVSCTTPENGTLSVSPTSGYNGVQVTITATPNSGYELATLTATDDEGEITITDNKFNIRNSNVTVAATFTPVIVYEWVPVAIGDLTGSDIFVIVGSHSGTYAMTNNNGTGSAPTATSVTISGGKITSTVTDNMIWNISGNSTDGYTFYPNGTTSTWLYCNTTASSSSNNNMRVGTGSRKVFKQDASNHLLTKDTYTDRYVSVYSSGSDWRGYVSNSTEPTTVAFYKRVIPAAVETPVISLATGTYNTNQSVTITCATDGATIYYTTDGSTPTSSSTQYTEAVSITQTTTLKAIAIKGDDESNVASATYTLKCATPTFSPVAGAYTSVQNVTITCATDGASIYYTTDGSTPTSSSTAYSSAISIDETTTLKAIAIKSNWSDSDVASAAYTIELPLSTMQAIFDRATAVDNTATNVNITLGGWVVSGVSTNGKNVFVTDGTKGFVIYDKDASMGFTVGNILTGTVACKVQLYNGFAELTNLNSSTTGISIATGGVVGIADIAMADLTGVNTGALISYNDLTYSSSGPSLSNGATNIKPYTSLYDYGSTFTDTKKYHVTGVFQQYSSTKQIHPRSAADIVLAADMSATDLSGLTAFSYVVNNGPSAAQNVGIDGSDFAGNLTITASSDYEICTTENGTYTSSIEVEQEQGEIAETLYIRLIAGLATGEHNGTLTFTATNLTTIEQALEGTVTAIATYDIMIDSPIAHGTVTASASVAEAGTTITLTATPDECYQFVEWVTEPDDLTWTSANQFTMPAEDVLVSATFNQIVYTIQYSVNGVVESGLQENVNCGSTASLWNEDELEIAGVELPTECSLLGWSSASGNTEILSSLEPEANATLYAVLAYGDTSYDLVTSVSELSVGDIIVIASNIYNYAMSTTQNTNNRGQAAITKTDNHITITTSVCEFVLGEGNVDNTWSFYDGTQSGYIYAASSSSNYLKTEVSLSNNSSWEISISEGIASVTAQGSNTHNVLQHNNGSSLFSCYSSASQTAISLYKKHSSAYTNVLVEDLTGDITLTEPTYIPAGTIVDAGNHTITTSAANLIIEDGAQLIHTNAVNATLQKSITAASSWRDDADGWYFIASPVSNLSTSAVTGGSSSSDYDLFAYDEITAYWHSNTGTLAPFDTLERGKGYLYANKYSVSLDIAGLMIGTETEVTKPLSFTPGQISDVRGFNLMGNPFTRDLVAGDIIKTTGDNTKGDTVITAYYGINDATTGMVVRLISETPIKPGQGFFVQSKTANQKLVFNPSKKDEPVDKGYISIAAGNDDYMDKAYVQIKNGNTLRKMNIANSTSVSVMYHGDDYAAARVDELAEIMPVNFKAVEDGTYTITVEAKQLEARRMILIDNFTYKEIDLLLEPSYTFHASADDPETRFLLAFNFNNYDGVDENNTESVFAYQNGNDIIVNGEGTLQVFDMLGRLVTSFTVNGNERISTSQFNTGVYIFRMVGSEVKTQKIVVR